jgi:RimJ/RimL family protein N-acetyltransferase
MKQTDPGSLVLETPRLILRPPKIEDFDAWAAFLVDEEATSQAVARKLGSTRLRRVRMPVPFEHMPVDAWGQTREQWRATRSADPARPFPNRQ